MENKAVKTYKIAYIGIDLLYPALPVLASFCEIAEVVSCRTDNETEFNREVCAFAERNHIPLKIGKVCPEDLERWYREGCRFAVCGGYYYKIPVSDKLPVINIHPALLPIGRGAWPMPVTILKGLDKSGVTLHKMTDRLDEGDILLQREIPVYPRDNHRTLLERQRQLLPEMMKRLVSDFDALYRDAVPQEDGEYWETVEEQDFPIMPRMKPEEADLILRAFYGYECIYDTGAEKYGVLEGQAHKGEGSTDNLPLNGGFISAKRIRRLL
ncbi:MAG: formyltransferase family protein [Eubacteriales bacterium]|nr:formyltransferase family protein [Eubacteriales bacterium]